MMSNIEWRLPLFPLVVVGLLITAACAPREPEEEGPLITLLGEDIYRDAIPPVSELSGDEADRMQNRLSPEEWEEWQECARWRPLREHIHSELIAWLVEQHGLEPTREEVEQYIHYVAVEPMARRDPDVGEIGIPDEDTSAWKLAHRELSSWKIQNTLYDLYGGRIVVDRGGHWVAAHDGFARFLRASEEEELLQFHSETLRETFWNCLHVDEIQYPREYVKPDDEVALKTLREFPGTRRLRIMMKRLDRLMGEGWMETFEEMEHPPDWQPSAQRVHPG